MCSGPPLLHVWSSRSEFAWGPLSSCVSPGFPSWHLLYLFESSYSSYGSWGLYLSYPSFPGSHCLIPFSCPKQDFWSNYKQFCMKMGKQNINLQKGLWRHDRDAGMREEVRKKKIQCPLLSPLLRNMSCWCHDGYCTHTHKKGANALSRGQCQG